MYDKIFDASFCLVAGFNGDALTADEGRDPLLDPADKGRSLLSMIGISPVTLIISSSVYFVFCLVSRGAVVGISDISCSGKAVEGVGSGGLLKVTVRSTGVTESAGVVSMFDISEKVLKY